jgi:hypothetical protein
MRTRAKLSKPVEQPTILDLVRVLEGLKQRELQRRADEEECGLNFC